jgi:hypothetical protein
MVLVSGGIGTELHGAEFVEHELTATVPDAPLPENYRPR